MGRPILLHPAGAVSGRGIAGRNSGSGSERRRSGHAAGGDAQLTQAAASTVITPQRSLAGSTPQGLNRIHSFLTGAALGSGGNGSNSGLLQRRSFGRVTGNDNRQIGAGRSPLIGSKRQVPVLVAAFESSLLYQYCIKGCRWQAFPPWLQFLS